ncbi:hypothetical protein NZD89_13765 [Alicyclobacillus fastidiosus]|uniref:Uncharacterized protein n=1 Tax=Alicyclobacillus fastidiosus TaxID=392011 RepID=A0ABY6ZNE0_9BACL|nr:hypothetical protein [Alicyclobacillus fastidiosus]WAH44356.1 hypothetical protein NZD89_13765 [Alicyclobacillus fastidiosus]
MVSLLMFLPQLFRYFGMFQSFMGFVRPAWPFLSRIWRRTPAVAAA